MEKLDAINESNRYSTMIVLPTGGGKTYTASMWLLKNALEMLYGLDAVYVYSDYAINSFEMDAVNVLASFVRKLYFWRQLDIELTNYLILTFMMRKKMWNK